VDFVVQPRGDLSHGGRSIVRWPAFVKSTNSRVVWHAGFWTFHTVNELLIAVVEQRSLLYVAGGILKVFGFLATVSYINLLVLVPLFFRRGRRAAHLLVLVAFAAASAFLYVSALNGQLAWNEGVARRTLRWTFTGLLYAGSVAAFDLAVRHFALQRTVAVQRLEQLRAQLDPHFLFNTLNSLYALAVRRAPELPDLMLRHASLLRHSLEQSRRADVALVSEIEFLSAYLELQRLRFDDASVVDFEVLGVVGDQRIAPMIFTPLIENCFKHLGVDKNGQSRIRGDLTVAGHAVKLSLRNTFATPAFGAANGGIGLANTRERLELLYPGRHQLTVGADNGDYVCQLQLTLTPSGHGS
jgi:hypothetical protein